MQGQLLPPGQGREQAFVEAAVQRRGGSHDELVAAAGVGQRRAAHGQQVALHLLRAAAGQQGDDGARGVEARAGGKGLEALAVRRAEGGHLVDRGVAHVRHGVVVFLLEKVGFEGQDGEQAVDVSAYGLDASLLPGPYFGRNVVENGADGRAVDVAGHLQVEARVVDEDDSVGLPAADGLLAALHAGEDARQVEQDGHEAHVGQRAVMAEAHAACTAHQVAAVEAERGVGVEAPQGFHQVGGVQVAAGLAYDEKILHVCRFSGERGGCRPRAGRAAPKRCGRPACGWCGRWFGPGSRRG